jgi:hypothetical protein
LPASEIVSLRSQRESIPEYSTILFPTQEAAVPMARTWRLCR